MRVVVISIALLFIGFNHAVDAASQSSSSADSGQEEKQFLGHGVSWRFDNTNAPDELVFKLIISNIFSEVLETLESLGILETLDHIDDLDSLDKELHRAGHHYIEHGLTGKMRSADVVRYFAKRYPDIEKEVESLFREMLCNGDRPRYEGRENFFIIDQLADVSLHVYERHLFLARADLQASGLFDLDKAIREFPPRISSWYTDHEVAYDGSVPRILTRATQLCSEPWTPTFSIPVPAVDDPD